MDYPSSRNNFDRFQGDHHAYLKYRGLPGAAGALKYGQDRDRMKEELANYNSAAISGSGILPGGIVQNGGPQQGPRPLRRGRSNENPSSSQRLSSNIYSLPSGTSSAPILNNKDGRRLNNRDGRNISFPYQRENEPSAPIPNIRDGRNVEIPYLRENVPTSSTPNNRDPRNSTIPYQPPREKDVSAHVPVVRNMDQRNSSISIPYQHQGDNDRTAPIANNGNQRSDTIPYQHQRDNNSPSSVPIVNNRDGGNGAIPYQQHQRVNDAQAPLHHGGRSRTDLIPYQHPRDNDSSSSVPIRNNRDRRNDPISYQHQRDPDFGMNGDSQVSQTISNAQGAIQTLRSDIAQVKHDARKRLDAVTRPTDSWNNVGIGSAYSGGRYMAPAAYPYPTPYTYPVPMPMPVQQFAYAPQPPQPYQYPPTYPPQAYPGPPRPNYPGHGPGPPQPFQPGYSNPPQPIISGQRPPIPPQNVPHPQWNNRSMEGQVQQQMNQRINPTEWQPQIQVGQGDSLCSPQTYSEQGKSHKRSPNPLKPSKSTMNNFEALKDFIEEKLATENVDFDELRESVFGRPNFWRTTDLEVNNTRALKDLINKAELSHQIEINRRAKSEKEAKEKEEDEKLERSIQEYNEAQKLRLHED